MVLLPIYNNTMKIIKINFSTLTQNIPLTDFKMFYKGLSKCGPIARKKRGRYHYIAITKYNKIIGFISYFKQNNNTCHIDLLEIHPNHRKKGLGKKLIQYLEKQCISNNIKTIRIKCKSNRLIKYYAKLNFKKEYKSKLRMFKHI